MIVVGLGAMGSAATYQLVSRGLTALAIDRFDPPHAMGSSHGETRITRFLYNYGPEVALVRRSHQIWHQLETENDVELLTTTGGVFIANSDAGSSWIDGLVAEVVAQTSLTRLSTLLSLLTSFRPSGLPAMNERCTRQDRVFSSQKRASISKYD